MFFQGTLQEGIASALQRSKFVVCFVADDQAESRLWEQDWLKDESLTSQLQGQALTLRLTAGSEEAAYLAAIFPLPKTPTLVIIRNGELKEYIAAGVSKEEFSRRLQAVLGGTPAQHGQQAQPQGATAPATRAVQPLAPAVQGSEGSSQHSIPSSSGARQPRTTAAPQAQGRSVLEEKLARHEAIKKEDEEAERRRKAKGKAKAEEEPHEEPHGAEEAGTGAAQTSTAASSAAQAYRQKQLDRMTERRRILKQIEDDKAERRARREEREAERRAALGLSDVDMAHELSAGSAVAAGAGGTSSSSSRHSETCALQVRLLDGSTIRTRLPSTSSLRKDVRTWVDESRQDGGGAAYTFKLILTPLPNKNIDDTEEDRTLDELGLTPSATMVLIPVQRASAAYAGVGAGAGGGGLPVLSPLYRLVVGFFSSVLGLFAIFFGGVPEQQQVPEQYEMEDMALAGREAAERRVRGFRNGDDDREQQLYNGNSLNFEPRRDEDEVDK